MAYVYLDPKLESETKKNSVAVILTIWVFVLMHIAIFVNRTYTKQVLPSWCMDEIYVVFLGMLVYTPTMNNFHIS